MTKTVQTASPNGEIVAERRTRFDGRSQLALVRAFYLDIAQWAMEEPARWDRYVPGAGRYEYRRDDDPLVRAVRRPASDFESGLILTLYGKVLRWGPGWWLNHPEGLSDEQQAIAAQLRGIEASDPSQALRSRRDDPTR